MARKRDIDPSFWANEQLGAVAREARLLFAGLISFADDEGRLKASASYLRATVFPYDTDLSADEVHGWLSSLALAGLVCTYETERGAVAHLPTWHAWQSINRRFDSKIGPCPKHGPCPEHEPVIDPPRGDDDSRTTHAPITDKSVSSEQQLIDQWLTSEAPVTDESSTTGAGPDRTVTEEITDSCVSRESVQQTRRKRRSDSGPMIVPDSIRSFHDSLAELNGYAPTQAFLNKVAEKYSRLDLDEEVIKLKGWLRANPGKRRDVLAFTLNWLKKASEHPPRSTASGRPTPIRAASQIGAHPPEDPEIRRRRREQVEAQRAIDRAEFEAAGGVEGAKARLGIS